MPLLFVTVLATVEWFIFWIIPRGRQISAAVASVVVLVTMLWGVFPQLPQRFILTGDLIALLVFMVGGVMVVYFRRAVNKAIPVVTAIVVIAILFSLVTATVGIATAGRGDVTQQSIAETGEDYPDIYFIIPDRFGSPDALRESGLSEENIAWFVQELEDRGFYVREDALSADPINPKDRSVSTTRTLRFLASILNLGEPIDLHIGYNDAGRMVRNPQVIQALHSLGFACYNIGSWYPETAISRVADYNYVYVASNPVQRLYTQEFGAAVLDRSIWRYFSIAGDQTERDRQMFQLDSVKEIAGNGVSPKYVFVHLILPHPPFIWTADGQPQEGQDIGCFLESYLFDWASSKDMLLYLQQVVFTEHYLLDMIDSISDDAIIILQSDEGVCFTRAGANDDLSNAQWNGVLTAWRIPGVDDTELETVGQTDILGHVIGMLMLGES